MVITLANPAGLHFTLMNVYNSGKTKATCGYKFILMNCPLEEICKRWYSWVVRDEPIETAFNNLDEYEREFLTTGRSPITEELGEY
jgi:hypothetical protein